MLAKLAMSRGEQLRWGSVQGHLQWLKGMGMVPKRIPPAEGSWEPAVPREFRCVRVGAGTRTATGGRVPTGAQTSWKLCWGLCVTQSRQSRGWLPCDGVGGCPNTGSVPEEVGPTCDHAMVGTPALGGQLGSWPWGPSVCLRQGASPANKEL